MTEAAGGSITTDREPTAPTIDTTVAAEASLRRARSLLLPGLVVAGCLATAACTTGDQAKIDPDLGVAPSPRVVGSNEPVPPGGGRYLTGKPYRIGGRWFQPMDNPSTDYEVIGIASWYGSNFHGRRTANGEVFNSKSLSAAHPTLPLPSYIRVTNLNNGRSIILRVNDRGPFHGRRVIDVSALAADKLDFKRKGMARVKVQYVGPAQLDGRDHEELLASYREPGETLGGAPGTPVPAARSLVIASAEAHAAERRPAPAARQSSATEIMLARSRRTESSPIAVLQRAPKPAKPTAAAAPVQDQARALELASAQPLPAPTAALPDPSAVSAVQPLPDASAAPALPGVGTALATAADPAVADPTLAATADLAMASDAGMSLPRPRPGSMPIAVAAAPAAPMPVAEPVAEIAPQPAIAPAEEMQVAAVSFEAPMPARKPATRLPVAYPATVVPAAPAAVAAQPAVSAPAPVAAAPASIDDLLAPPSGAPAGGFAPSTPAGAPSAQGDDLGSALARYIAGANAAQPK